MYVLTLGCCIVSLSWTRPLRMSWNTETRRTTSPRTRPLLLAWCRTQHSHPGSTTGKKIKVGGGKLLLKV